MQYLAPDVQRYNFQYASLSNTGRCEFEYSTPASDYKIFQQYECDHVLSYDYRQPASLVASFLYLFDSSDTPICFSGAWLITETALPFRTESCLCARAGAVEVFRGVSDALSATAC